MNYSNDTTWRKVQSFLPARNRISENNLPQEYFIKIDELNVHIDHYKVTSPKGLIIMFHGVGGNGRLLSFISTVLSSGDFDVVCPDLPLYGYSEYCSPISYHAWVDCGAKIVNYFQETQSSCPAFFLFGLSAGGMLAYQVACKTEKIKGVVATCILDQRNPEVTKLTAVNPVLGTLGKKAMRILNRIFPKVIIPMKMVSNMKGIVNNEELAKILMYDSKSSGAKVSIAFLHTMLNPIIDIEPENFIKCPFLLVHPEKDNWTDLSLSKMFFDRLACKKDLKLLKDAGHFPIEPEGLKLLEEYSLDFFNSLLN